MRSQFGKKGTGTTKSSKINITKEFRRYCFMVFSPHNFVVLKKEGVKTSDLQILVQKSVRSETDYRDLLLRRNGEGSRSIEST